jgi:PTH1 family peptidyl-tRNA hydrolase
MTDDRWLVVGLGNPEGEYGGTRHNIGADLVRRLAARHHRDLERNKRIRCESAEVAMAGRRVAMVIPLSYMNTSGGPVQQAARWFDTDPAHVIVCHDELDVPLGAVKLKLGGGTAGHNGLKDVERALGTADFHRVRIGVGRPPGRMAGRDFVLRRFAPKEREIVDVTLEDAADAITLLIEQGLEPAQNLYHAKNNDPRDTP